MWYSQEMNCLAACTLNTPSLFDYINHLQKIAVLVLHHCVVGSEEFGLDMSMNYEIPSKAS
jgi:hypothetical protein